MNTLKLSEFLLKNGSGLLRDAIIEECFLIKTFTSFEPEQACDDNLEYVIQATAISISKLIENRLKLADVRRKAKKLRMRFKGFSGGDSDAEPQEEPDPPKESEADSRQSLEKEDEEHEQSTKEEQQDDESSRSGEEAQSEEREDAEKPEPEGEERGSRDRRDEAGGEESPEQAHETPAAVEEDKPNKPKTDIADQIKQTWKKLFGKSKEEVVDSRYDGISSEDYMKDRQEEQDKLGLVGTGEDGAKTSQEDGPQDPAEDAQSDGRPENEENNDKTEDAPKSPKISLREKLGLSPLKDTGAQGNEDADFLMGSLDKQGNRGQSKPVIADDSDFVDLIDFGVAPKGPESAVKNESVDFLADFEKDVQKSGFEKSQTSKNLQNQYQMEDFDFL